MKGLRNIVRRRWAGVWITALLAGTAAAWLGGCGQKITVPQPRGLFSVAGYYFDSSNQEGQPVQLALINGMLFVLDGSGTLIKRTTRFEQVAAATGLAQPTAFCADQAGRLVFVWCQGDHRIRVLQSSDLSPVEDSEALAYVDTVAGMTACARGVEAVPGALTFVYLSDPASGVIHRYAYTPSGGLTAYGLLARRSGLGARSVLVPAGLAADRDGMVLVCDADTSRNWVIRFDPMPSPGDVTPLWHDMEPMRGRVVTFSDSLCSPPSAADVTLGNAAGCDPSTWHSGTFGDGWFSVPRGVALDGLGRIFVADTGNDRVQIFSPDGEFASVSGNADQTPAPVSLGCTDEKPGTRWNYGAYLFVLTPQDGLVRKFVSVDQYHDLNPGKPPPQ